MEEEDDTLALLNKTNTNPGNNIEEADPIKLLNSGQIKTPLHERGLSIDDSIKGIDHSFLDSSTPLGYDINEQRAAAQSTLDKWGHGVMKGISTFATASGQTAGIVGGGVIATSMAALGNDFDSDLVFKNPIIEFFSHVNDVIAERHPNYTSQVEQNASVVSNMAGANFWSDKFLNGLGFMASAIVTGGGAASLGAKLGINTATKVGSAINTFQAAVIGRMGESGIEANDTYEQTIQTLEAARESGENNYSDIEIEELAKDARAAAFGFNMMLAIPDAYQLGKIFKTVRGKDVGRSIFGKGRLANAAEQLIIESQEENFQLSVSNMAIKMANNMSSRTTETGAGEYLGNIIGGMIDNFRTKEGQESMVLGGLLGGGMGLAFHTNDRSDIVRNNQDDNIIKRNNILVRSLNNDVDAEALKKVAIEKNDLVSAILIEDMQLTNLIYSKLVTGKIEEFIEEVEATSKQTPEQFLEAFEQEVNTEEINDQKSKILAKVNLLQEQYNLYPDSMHEAVKGNLLFLNSAQSNLRDKLMVIGPLVQSTKLELEQRGIPEDQLDNPITLNTGETIIPNSLLKEQKVLQDTLKILNEQVKIINEKTKRGKAAREEIISNAKDIVPSKKEVTKKEPTPKPENLEDYERVQVQGEAGKIYTVLKEVDQEDKSITTTLLDRDGNQKIVNSKETTLIPTFEEKQDQTNRGASPLPAFNEHEITKRHNKEASLLQSIISTDPNWKSKVKAVIHLPVGSKQERLDLFNSGEKGKIKDSNVYKSADSTLLFPSMHASIELSVQDDAGNWHIIGHAQDTLKFTDELGNPIKIDELTEDAFFRKFKVYNKEGNFNRSTESFERTKREYKEALSFQNALADYVKENNVQEGDALPERFLEMYLAKKKYAHTPTGEFTTLTEHNLLKDENDNYVIVDTNTMKSIIDGSSHQNSIPEADLISLEGNNRYLIRATHPTLGHIWVKAVPKTYITTEQGDSLLNAKDKGINQIRLNPTKEQLDDLNAAVYIAYQGDWKFSFESTGKTKKKGRTLKLNIRKDDARYNVVMDRYITSLQDLTNIIEEQTKGEIQLSKTAYKKNIPLGIIDNKTAEKTFTVNVTPEIVEGAKIKFNFKTEEFFKTPVKKKRVGKLKKVSQVKHDKPTKNDLRSQAEKSQEDNESSSNIFENNDPFKKSAFKVSEILNYSDAKKWLSDKLPSGISIEEMEAAVDNLDKNKHIWGMFSDDTIFLAKDAGEGTQYHEAFHAVFRTLLTQAEINKLYVISSNKWGKGKSDIFYEEKMADEFMKWKIDQSTKISSPLRSFFKRLMEFAKWITGQKTELDLLFKAIDNGSFRNKTINKSNTIKFHSPAYKMLVGNDFYKMSAIRSEDIIFTTAATVIDQLGNEVYTHKKDEQDFIINKLVDEYMDSQAIIYDYESESNNRFQGDDKIQKELVGLETIYKSEKNRNLIKEEIKKLLSMMTIGYTEIQGEESDENEFTERQFDLHQGEVGGFGSLSKEVKQFISLTTFKTEDAYGNNITKALNPTNVYYALLRRVSSNPRHDILKEFKEFSETDAQISALYEKFLRKTGYDGDTVASVTDKALFNRFLNAFELTDADYIQSLTDGGELFSMSANRESSDVIHFNNWERNASEANIFTDKKSRLKASIQLQRAYYAFDLVEPTEEDIIASIQTVLDAFNVIGVELSLGYVKRSLLEAHGLRDASEKRLLTREDVEELSRLITSEKDTLFSQHRDPTTGELIDSSGARSRLIDIAGGDTLYRTDIYETSYQDAEGKTRYSFVQPSFIFTKVRELRTADETEINRLQNDPYFKYNPLIQSANLKEILANIKLAFTGDYSNTALKNSANTFKSTDPRSLLLSWYGLYNRKGLADYAYYTPMIYEAKSTAVSVKLPKNLRKWFNKGKLSKETKGFLFNTLFLQEHQRINGQTGILFKERKTNPWVTLPMMNNVEFGDKFISEYTLQEFDTVEGLKAFIIKILAQGIEDDIKRHRSELERFNIDHLDLNIKEEEFEDYISNYYMDDFINSVSISQLLTGDLAKFKSPSDNVKRMGGLIAYGTHFGDGNYKVVYKYSDMRLNPYSGVEDLDADDAQVWVSVKRRMYQLEQLGRLPDKVRDVYEKIREGIELTPQEDKLIDAISLKTVHYDGTVYHKMSEAMLSRALVSQKDTEGNWISKPGREEGHNMLEFMEHNEVDSIVTVSASKILRASKTKGGDQVSVIPSDGFKNGVPTKIEVGVLANEFLRLQVEMKSGKEQIVSGTQMAQLVDLLYESNPELQQKYYNLLAENRQVDFKFALRMISNQADVSQIAKKLVDTLESSGGDAQTIDLLSTQPIYEKVGNTNVDTGRVEFKYNLNLPHVAEKIEQIFLSHMTKGVLQQKVPGYKLTLMSAVGFKKADDTELQMHRISADGKTVELAEVMMTRGALRKLLNGKEYKNLEDIDTDLLTMVGTRIPTQAHHSMMPFKVVEFLPEFYGDVIIAPAEIVALSGADYDIDSLFVYRKDFYVDVDGEVIIYGKGKTINEKYSEYINYHTKVNKTIKRAIKEATLQFANLNDIPIDGLSANEEIRELVFEEYGLHVTIEDFKASRDHSTNGARNNELVDIYLKILTDAEVEDLFVPVSMDLIENASNRIYSDIKNLGNTKDNPLHHSVSGKLKAHTAVSTGKKNIGPIAAANNVNAFLTKSRVVLSTPIEFLGKEYADYGVITEDDIDFVEVAKGVWGVQAYEEANKRVDFSKINSLSTLVSAMTDDTKHGYAAKLNLEQFNLHIFANMIALGMGFNRTMLFSSQPVLLELSEFINTSGVSQESATAEFLKDYNIGTATQLTEDSLLTNLTERDSSVDSAILTKYLQLEEAGQDFQSIGRLLKLNKGDVGITVNESKELQKAIDTTLANKAFANLREAVQNNANINTNISLLKSLNSKLGEWFVGGSKAYKKLENSLRPQLRENLSNQEKKDLDRSFRSYMTMKGLEYVARQQKSDFNLSEFNFLANPNILGETLAKEIQKLSKDKSFTNNEAIKALSVFTVFTKEGFRNDGNKTNLDQVTTNTRMKRSPLTNDRIVNGFFELQKDHPKLVRDMLRYSLVKDNLGFKNGSFLKYLDLSMFAKVSEGLDIMMPESGQDLVDVNEFKKLFLTYSENSSMLADTAGTEIITKNKGNTIEALSNTELDKEPYETAKRYREKIKALPRFIIQGKRVYYKSDPSINVWARLNNHGSRNQSPYHMSYEEAVINDKYIAEVSGEASVDPRQDILPITEEQPSSAPIVQNQNGKKEVVVKEQPKVETITYTTKEQSKPSNPFEHTVGKFSKISNILEVNIDRVDFTLKAISILQTDKAKQVFEKGKKNGWDLNKILTELQVPKDQKQIILEEGKTSLDEIIISLASENSFSVEITTKGVIDTGFNEEDNQIEPDYDAAGNAIEPESTFQPTQYYANLTVPGGTKYTENEIHTPEIIPNIKGHAEFSTDNGIGWFRSDTKSKNNAIKIITDIKDIKETSFVFSEPDSGEQITYEKRSNNKWYVLGGVTKDASGKQLPLKDIWVLEEYNKVRNINKGESTRTRRILELQSDLFQKGRDKKDLFGYENKYTGDNRDEKLSPEEKEVVNRITSKNNFLQLLNKKGNWVNFFIQSIVHDSAKKGYKKVLFPTGETAAKVEGHQTIADNLKFNQEQLDKLKKVPYKNKNGTYTGWLIGGSHQGLEVEVDTFKDLKEATRYYEDAKQELLADKQEMKTQGLEKLKPIEAFYTNRVTNLLNKNYKVIQVTDEYGNTWNEVDLSQEGILDQIVLQKTRGTKVNPKTTKTLNKKSTIADLVNYNFHKAITKLSRRFGVKVELVHQPNATWKGRYQGGIVFLNTALLTGDTLFHEFAHPFIESIRKDNPALYASLQEQIEKEGTILKEVQELYPELDYDGQIDEAIATSIGRMAEGSLPKTLLQKLKAFLKSVMSIVRGFFEDGSIFLPSELNPNTTLQDLGALMAKGNQVFDLGELTEDQARYQKQQTATKLAVQPEHIGSIRLGEKVISLRDVDPGNDVIYKEGDILDIYAHGKEQGIKVKVKTTKILDSLKDVNKDDFAKALGYEDYKDFTSRDRYAKEDSTESMRFPSVYRFLQGKQKQQILYYEVVEEYNTAEETRLTKTIKEVQEALQKQIHNLTSKITKKNTRREIVIASVKQRERLLDNVQKLNDVQGLEVFIDSAHKDIINSKKRLTDELSGIDSMRNLSDDKRKQVMNTIKNVTELISAYHMIASISTDQMKEMSGQTELTDKMTETQQELKNLTNLIDTNAIPLTAAWLMTFNTVDNATIEKEFDEQLIRIQKSTRKQKIKDKLIAKIKLDKANMLLTQETMEDLLRQAARDISFGSLAFEAAISSSDRVTGLFAKALKFQEFKANVEDTIVRNRLGIVLKAYEVEQGSKGVNPEKFYADLYEERKDEDGVKQIYLKETASTPAGTELLKELKEVYADAQDKLPESLKMGDMIPFARKEGIDMAQSDGLLATMKAEWKEITQPVATDTAYGYQDASGKAIRQVPIFYVHRGQDGKAINNNEISKNLVGSILAFTQMANKYQQYTAIQAEVDTFEEIIKSRTVKETTIKGNNIIDKVADKVGLTKYITSDTARVNTRVQEFINMAYYGIQEKPMITDFFGPEVDINKLLNFLGKWTGFTTLAFNFLSAINNVILGNFYIFQESVARQHFGDMQFNLAKGKKLYFSGVPRMLNDFGGIGNLSKETQLVDFYDAMQGSFRDSMGHFESGNKAKKLFTTNSLFFANQAGEHEMQVSTLFAALDAKKVKTTSGEEISLWDAYSINGKGSLELRSDVQWSESERFNFMNKIHAINKSLHGNYNDFDKTVIQKNAFGRLAIMFRKFMSPGIRRRYGQKIVDVESGEIHEGFNRQFFRQLRNETMELANWALFKENGFTDYEKSNLRRATFEMGAYIATMAMFMLASAAMDDDDADNWIVGMTLYEIRRFQSELGFYLNFTEPIKILKSPTASSTTLERIAKFTDQMVHTMIIDTEYTHYKTSGKGYKKGDSKLWASTKKLLPIIQGVERTMSPGEALKYFTKPY